MKFFSNRLSRTPIRSSPPVEQIQYSAARRASQNRAQLGNGLVWISSGAAHPESNGYSNCHSDCDPCTHVVRCGSNCSSDSHTDRDAITHELVHTMPPVRQEPSAPRDDRKGIRAGRDRTMDSSSPSQAGALRMTANTAMDYLLAYCVTRARMSRRLSGTVELARPSVQALLSAGLIPANMTPIAAANLSMASALGNT